MEPFMATNGDFKRPVDLEIGPDGVFYMLEYGSVYGIDNVDARLVRIDYNGGNRNPVTKITTKDTIGLAPYKVAFSSNKSFDPDEDDDEDSTITIIIVNKQRHFFFSWSGYRIIMLVTSTST